MKLQIKILSLFGLSGAGSPLFAHSGVHQMSAIDAIAHFFSSPLHLGTTVAVCVLFLLAIIKQIKAR